MKRWMTITEIANAALPDLPASQQGMDKLARAEGWSRRPGMSRPRKESGGGLEYSIALLPEEARRALIARDGVFTLHIDPPVGWQENDQLTKAERDRSDARIYALKLFEAFRRVKRLSHRDARQLFPVAWKGGLVAVPEWVRAIVPSLSKKSIDSWSKIRREKGDDALGIDLRGRPAVIDTAAEGKARMALIALVAKNEFLSADKVGDYLRDNFSEELASVSTRTVQRARARIEVEDRNVLLKIRDPDGWRSKVELSGHNMTFSAGLNDLWEEDASPADVMLKGKKRHSIYMAIDVWSRRTKVVVTQTPRSEAVAALTRKCILAWGIPNRIKTDQGSDFKSRATVRLFAGLGIGHDLCDPYDPKGKPNVERVIKTFQHDLSICPGFIGHSVADRKKIENRKAFSKRLGMEDHELFDVDMDLVEFQAWCDEWSDLIYAHRLHGGLKKPARTPFLKAASWMGEAKKMPDADALNVLVAPIAGGNGRRRVTKKGVQINSEFYLTKAAQPGEDVFVRMDPTDLGRILIFSLDGETYLGLGICPPLIGEDPVKVAIEMKAAQKTFEKEKIDPLRKEMKKIKPRDVMAAVRNQASKRASTLVQMPRPSTPYSTPALDAAKAASAGLVPEVEGYTPVQREQVSAAIIAMPKPTPVPQLTPQQKFEWAQELEAQIARGDEIASDEARRLKSYQLSPEYKAWKRVTSKRGPATSAG
jgi:putative transposase